MKNLLPKKSLYSGIEKMFVVFLTIGFLFLICLLIVGGVFLYKGISDFFIGGFSVGQVERSMHDIINGIEFIFISSVPYLLIVSVQKYLQVIYPFTAIRGNLIKGEQNYESVQKVREEILFVRSLIASMLIAVTATHMISHILDAVGPRILDIPLAVANISLLFALIFYYAQIEKGLPPNVHFPKSADSV